MNVHKGEQFAVPFEINIGEEVVTPYNVDGVRIKINNTLQQWPNGELEFDEYENVWLFSLHESDTRNMFAGKRPAQIAVKIGNNILKSDVFDLDVKNSIIMEPWNDG